MARVPAIVPTAGLDAVLVAAELALETGPPGKVSVEHVINVPIAFTAASNPKCNTTACKVVA
jgi:hypothetical protein